MIEKLQAVILCIVVNEVTLETKKLEMIIKLDPLKITRLADKFKQRMRNPAK